jgi:penicillin amidase
VLARVGAGLARLPAMLGRRSAGPGQGVGSNSWVVDGEHSATGAPLLANDPHLGISLPGIWVQMGLHCRTVTEACPLDVAGFTFSGVPGVVIGHNADIAWGFTNLGPDVTDLFLERVEGDQYVHAGRRQPLEIRRETIEVRGADDFELVVRETGHGPLISDVSTELSSVGANAQVDTEVDRGNGFAVSLAWTALTPNTTADAIFKLNQATGWEDFREAAREFAVPAQNLLYADRDGHIGYQAPGLVPIRRPGNDGVVPSEGWLARNDWTGRYVPFDALPSVLDPDEGMIVAANQAVTEPGYPYFLTFDWDHGYRSQRIRDVLATEGELSVQEMTHLQLDDLNPMASTLVPYLLDVSDVGSAYYRDGVELLQGWDFHQPEDSGAAAYYNVVWANVLRLTFHDELRESLWPNGGDRWFAVMEALLRRPSASWWDVRDTSEVETRDDILRQALRDARDELTMREALDPAKWTWGAVHTLDLRNATLGESGIGPIEWLLNREGYRIGGGSSIVNATSWDAGVGYEVTDSPSMRMVVSLHDFDDSRWINLTGVSGHPASGHYVDQTDLFVAGETLPWRFSRDAVEDAGEDVLVLEPGAED